MLQWVTRQGYLSLAAHCFASEGGLAYAPVAEWLRSGCIAQALDRFGSAWLAELARVMPEIHSERPTFRERSG